jgi:20S proteasome alpha/beta subunit
MTKNAAIKMGLEALRISLDAELNTEAVEISIIDSTGYETLDRDEVKAHLAKLKPLEE